MLSFSLLRRFKLDCASSGREEAFLALDAEWASLETHAGDGSKLRSPFLVCTDRYPHVIQGLEVLLHRVHPQLVYSRGDTACLVAGIRLENDKAANCAVDRCQDRMLGWVSILHVWIRVRDTSITLFWDDPPISHASSIGRLIFLAL